MPTTTKKRGIQSTVSGRNVQKNGATLAVGMTASGTYTDTRTTGANYKDYKQRIKNGFQATTSLSGTKYTAKYSRINCHGRLNLTGSVPPFPTTFVKGDLYGTIPLVPLVTPYSCSKATTVDDAAKVQLIRKAKKHLRSIQGGVFLGELTEAIRMIKHPARTFRRGLTEYLNALKKKRSVLRQVPKREHVRLATKIVSDTWLEYSFGLVPLVNDIDDAIEALANRLYAADRPYKVMIRGWSQADEYESGAAGQFGSNGCVFDMIYRYHTEYFVKYYGKLTVHHPVAFSPERLGLSFRDLMPTAWELLPWSFLFDYFTNIGDVIEAASFLQSNLAWVSRTVRHSTVNRPTVKFHPSTNVIGTWSGHVSGGSETELSVHTVSRAPYTTSLVPSVQFSLPGSGRQWLNISALLASARASQLL